MTDGGPASGMLHDDCAGDSRTHSKEHRDLVGLAEFVSIVLFGFAFVFDFECGDRSACS